MLILTRRIGENVFVGDDIVVTVVDINGNQIRLGFNAPKELAVHREEVYRRIQEEKKSKKIPAPSIPPATRAKRYVLRRLRRT